MAKRQVLRAERMVVPRSGTGGLHCLCRPIPAQYLCLNDLVCYPWQGWLRVCAMWQLSRWPPRPRVLIADYILCV